MTTRSAKRSVNAEGPQLNHIESLLLAQAAWESGTGASAWTTIAKILSKHPLVTRPKSFFTAQSCQSMYENLLQEAGLESNEESSSIRSHTNLALAQKHFQLRYNELRELIMVEENAFKTILKEIEEIKSDKWDAKIQATLTGQVFAEEKWPVNTNVLAPPIEPTFGGLDLSTGTSSSALVGNTTSENSTATNMVEDIPNLPQMGSQPSTDTTQTVSSNSVMEMDSNPEFSRDRKIEETNDTQMASTSQNKDKDSAPLRREEEEEEEDITTSKSEEEETDREDQLDEAENAAAEQAVLEELTKSPDHKVEGEDMEVNHDDQEYASARHASPPEVQDNSEKVEQPTVLPEEEAGSDEEHIHTTTRRSTRNRRPSVSSGPVVGTRKSRRQRRISEPDAQSPAATEAEPNETEETKAETPQPEDDLLSSPVPVDPVGTRRRKRKSSLVENVESPRDRKRQREESEPVDDDEPGPSGGLRGKRRGDRSEEQLALRRFQNVIGMLHSQISQHRNGNIFHNPIRTVEAPDYHDIVKRPMDLRTIKTRVKDGLITNSLEYQRDIYLMFANAMMYNRPGSDVYHMAEDMMHESEGYIMTFRQTEGLVRGRP